MKRDDDRAVPAVHLPDAHAATLTARVGRAGVRLDRFVAEMSGCSRRAARTLIRTGRVCVNARMATKAEPLCAGDAVRVLPAAEEAARLEFAPPCIRVLWRGDDLWVIAKPAGTHTHRGRSAASVAAALIAANASFLDSGASADEGGLVHRLDRDTSGVVLAATDRASYARLRTQFAARGVVKQYFALVEGSVAAAFSIEKPLARRATRVVAAHRRDRRLEAVTLVRPLEVGSSWSLVEVEMSTGVTHQVRAHLAYAGHALIGDGKYGGRPAPPGTRDGQLLHARSLRLADGRAFAAATPADFLRALAILRRRS